MNWLLFADRLEVRSAEVKLELPARVNGCSLAIAGGAEMTKLQASRCLATSLCTGHIQVSAIDSLGEGANLQLDRGRFVLGNVTKETCWVPCSRRSLD